MYEQMDETKHLGPVAEKKETPGIDRNVNVLDFITEHSDSPWLREALSFI